MEWLGLLTTKPFITLTQRCKESLYMTTLPQKQSFQTVERYS